MAGIGFELRGILRRDNLRSLIEAYTLAAILGSGPWILSMVGIVVIGLLSYGVAGPDIVLAEFQASHALLPSNSATGIGHAASPDPSGSITFSWSQRS